MEIVDMRVLVTGSKGQLGSDIVNELKKNHMDHFAADRSNFDLLNDSQMIEVLEKYQPTHVIHCAAYTHVDRAEVEKDLAYKVNVEATRIIVEWCQEHFSRLVFFSSDYVFDGKGKIPFVESDVPNPTNYYGYTKFEAEKIIQSKMKDYVIYRVSWLYGKNGSNFVKTISNLLKTKNMIQVVSDQVGTPTYTVDLASFVIEHFFTEQSGIYHLRNDGYLSWFEFASLIQSKLGTSCDIKEVESKYYSKTSTAKRPQNSRLGSNKNHTILRSVEDALQDYLTNEKY